MPSHVAAAAGSRILGLYHYPCIDGITAALSLHLHCKANGHPLRLIPHKTYEPLHIEDLDIKPSDVVYLLDYSGPVGFAQDVAQRAARTVVLDHHKTAAAHLPRDHSFPRLEVNLDMNRSGATIAYDYFKPPIVPQDTIKFIKLVEDGDLWRWALPGSRAFYAAMAAKKLEYDVQKNDTIFDTLLSLSTDELIERGEEELRRQMALIQTAIQRAYVIRLGGREQLWGRGLAVDVEGELVGLRSLLGNELAAVAAQRPDSLRPIAAVVYREKGGSTTSVLQKQLKVSLRSLREEDTTAISEAWGGGGHRNASSFMIDADEFIATWKES